ncbi:MAG: anthranilate phosphoribosyltransferase [Gammaproteobacteria bacterium]|nr:anthranilate phosphoribosyltransferase [Gammaproteobacteria bacterium]
MSHPITEDLDRLARGETLTQEGARDLMLAIMGGEASEAQIAAVLMALRLRGETVAEISGAAEAMRSLATAVPTPFGDLIDTCGTGGTGHKLFNVSTASAFVAAEGGARVAKHGNRGMTSTSGSADVLEAAGVRLDLTPEAVAQCIEELGIGFMFAQRHHSAMRFVGPVRQALKIRTVFNILGPLTNPAGAKRQVLGVFDHRWRAPLAEVLQRLGSQHVLVVHADDGLDEFSPAGPTAYSELKHGKITEQRVSPADFALPETPLAELRAAGPEESLTLIRKALTGTGPGAPMVAMNAGAALYVAGQADSLSDGVKRTQALAGSQP